MNPSIEEVAMTSIIIFEYVADPYLANSFCKQWTAYVDEYGIVSGRQAIVQISIALEHAYTQLDEDETYNLDSYGCWDMEIVERVLDMESGMYDVSDCETNMFECPMSVDTAAN